MVDALGETANLALLDGDQPSTSPSGPGLQSMRMFTDVGRRVDAHCTAVGKAMLAMYPDDDVTARLAAPDCPATPSTPSPT